MVGVKGRGISCYNEVAVAGQAGPGRECVGYAPTEAPVGEVDSGRGRIVEFDPLREGILRARSVILVIEDFVDYRVGPGLQGGCQEHSTREKKSGGLGQGCELLHGKGEVHVDRESCRESSWAIATGWFHRMEAAVSGASVFPVGRRGLSIGSVFSRESSKIPAADVSLYQEIIQRLNKQDNPRQDADQKEQDSVSLGPDGAVASLIWSRKGLCGGSCSDQGAGARGD